MPTLEFTVMTDENGYYQRSANYNPPGPFSFDVTVQAKLLSPDETQIIATLDLDAADGSTTNQAREFVISTGQILSLGRWHVDEADNVIVVNGRTNPPRSNIEVKIELEIAV